MVMNDLPLVSCIMIFLNAEKFIQEAIESVLAQTYSNWELILVDDGSTDHSTAIALQYVQQDSRMRYVEHENHQNRGTSTSRNLGINRAQGQYIAFLDADDVWLPHKLEQQVAIMKALPEAAMVYGQMELWYSWTGKPKDVRQDHFYELGVPPETLVQPPQLLINVLEAYYQEPGTGNTLISRKIFEKWGSFEENYQGWGEDKVFFAKIQLNEPVFVSGQCWFRYRQHSESLCHMTSRDREQIATAKQRFLNWLEEYLLTQDKKNTEVWETLQRVKARPRYRYRKSALYSLWIGFLKSVMVQGRQLLPTQLRRWLWISIGSKLYG